LFFWIKSVNDALELRMMIFRPRFTNTPLTYFSRLSRDPRPNDFASVKERERFLRIRNDFINTQSCKIFLNTLKKCNRKRLEACCNYYYSYFCLSLNVWHCAVFRRVLPAELHCSCSMHIAVGSI